MTYSKALILLMMFSMAYGLALSGRPLAKHRNIWLRLIGTLCLIASVILGLGASFALMSVIVVHHL